MMQIQNALLQRKQKQGIDSGINSLLEQFGLNEAGNDISRLMR
jgi:hypothetical protein